MRFCHPLTMNQNTSSLAYVKTFLRNNLWPKCKNITFKHQQVSLFRLPYMTHLMDKLLMPCVSCWLEVATSTMHMRKIANVSQKPTEQCFSNFAEHCQKYLPESQAPGMDIRAHHEILTSFHFSFHYRNCPLVR